MNKFNFNNKEFKPVQNSQEGEVSSETTFLFQQEDDLITADYHGGTVKQGKIIALLKDDKMEMRYHCITIDDELKAGKALAHISINDDGRMQLALDWEWLDREGDGQSIYIEV